METRLRPILFSGPMVRAILDGRKTQTRRVVKPQPPEWVTEFGYTAFTPSGSISGRGRYKDKGPAEKFFSCPYGKPGDRLWVRETWRHDRETDFEPRVAYRSDGQIANEKWRPSIFMPRWASRITLEVTNIRVERLQDITEEDAECEGVEPNSPPEATGATSRGAFKCLWDSINGKKYPWDSSPWVWVIEFKRIED